MHKWAKILGQRFFGNGWFKYNSLQIADKQFLFRHTDEDF